MERIYTDTDRVPERDPDPRRRLDGQAMIERDKRIAALRRRGVSYRVIAARLGISVGAVQRTVERNRAGRRVAPERHLPPPRHKSRFDVAADEE